MSLSRWVAKRIEKRVIQKRAPDFVIGRDSEPVLQRWRVLKAGPLALYIHRFLRDDPDQDLHDHPWDSLSWLVSGSYIELTESGSTVFRPGKITLRRAEYRHRICVPDQQLEAVVSVFLVGPKRRSWGFWKNGSFTPFQEMERTEVSDRNEFQEPK